VSASATALRDYDELRTLSTLTIDVISVTHRTLVLGSSQDRAILRETAAAKIDIRRRRGGGGVVLLDPGDVWIDVWLPTEHPLFTRDVLVQSMSIGQWWLVALTGLGVLDLELRRGTAGASDDARVACFASASWGEVVSPGGKLVGVTQWRPREGAHVSTLLSRRGSTPILDYLDRPAAHLRELLEHPTLESLGLSDRRDDVINGIVESAPSATLRRLSLPQ